MGVRITERMKKVYQRCTGWTVDTVKRGTRTVMRQVMRAGVAICIMRVLIVVELCVLGVGVVRRLENSYERAMEAARMELAALEARELRQEEASGAAGIGVADTDSSVSPPDEDGEDTHEAPALRARDVSTIITEETGDIEAATAVMEREAGSAPQSAEPTGEATKLSAEENEELDDLIRRGVSAMVAGDMRRCILSLEQATTMSPHHPAVLYYYGMAYDKLLNPRKARDYYAKLFRMREQAGKYFELASRRLTFGMEQPSALRGKLAFGPHRVQHTFDTEQGENVNILLPVMLARGTNSPGRHLHHDPVF